MAAAYALIFTATSQIAYVPSEGRLTSVDLTTGGRAIASGTTFAVPGFMAISPINGDIFFSDQGDRAIYRIRMSDGSAKMISGPGVGSGPRLSNRLFGMALLSSGFLVVADGDLGGGLLALVRVDPNSGDRTILSAGSNTSFRTGTGLNFRSPVGVAVDSHGGLLVNDYISSAVIAVDPATGNRTLLSGDPFGDNVGTGPNLPSEAGYVPGIVIFGGKALVGRIWINLATGNRTRQYQEYTWSNSWSPGQFITSDGRIIYAERGNANYTYLGGTLASLDPQSGVPSVIASDAFIFGPPARGGGPKFPLAVDIKLLSDGAFILTDGHLSKLVRIDQATGNRTQLACSRIGAGPEFIGPKGCAVLLNGNFVVAETGIGQFQDADFYGNPANTSPQLLQVDRLTGNRSVLSAGSNTESQRGSGSNFQTPAGVAVEKSGSVIVCDSSLSNPKVVRVDPGTGNRTIVSSSSVGGGPSLSIPHGVVIDKNGGLIVSDWGQNAVLRIDPATGNRTLISSDSRGAGETFWSIRGLAFLPDGALVVADINQSALFRVDPNSGDRTIFSDATHGTGPSFAGPCGVAIDDSGKLLVLNSTSGSVVRVDLVTGNRLLVSDMGSGSGPLIADSPEFLTVAPLPRLANPVRFGNGNVQFSLLTSSGTHCVVEWSSNFSAWTQLTNFASTSATNIVTDASSGSANPRFYRARIVP